MHFLQVQHGLTFWVAWGVSFGLSSALAWAFFRLGNAYATAGYMRDSGPILAELLARSVNGMIAASPPSEREVVSRAVKRWAGLTPEERWAHLQRATKTMPKAPLGSEPLH